MVLDSKVRLDIIAVTLGGIIIIGVMFGVFLVNAPIFAQPPSGSVIQKFKSYDEMMAYFEKARNDIYTHPRFFEEFALPAMTKSSASDTSFLGAEQGYTTGLSDYSTTNIQVEGVDEADIVKNDGKHVYARAQNKLFIIDAFPAEKMNKVAEIDFNSQSPLELFISKNSDRLIVFTSGYGSDYYYEGIVEPSGSIAMPYNPYLTDTRVASAKVYDITNKANPVLIKTIDFERGYYLSSRLIGEKVYFVVINYPDLYNTPIFINVESNKTTSALGDKNSIIPLIRIDGKEEQIAEVTEIGIIPHTVPKSFITIASIDLQNLELNKETFVGSAENLYSSKDNLYLAGQSWEYFDYNGFAPLEAGLIVKSIYFPEFKNIDKTIISKFHLNDGKIDYVGQGVVPGSILNQFNMDEFNNNFRIATTVSESWYEGRRGVWDEERNVPKNNLYVFDSDMNLVGVLENLAPGETIYSVRFIGERAYMVTFKKVDPLFVIDLADPSNPKVLGKLKIPGYSDYLHPMDSTHIIGIGKETIESSYGNFAWYQGLKMAIFDVTDVANPKEMHKIVIGDRGTDSEALHDHKAFLYNGGKKLLVMPISLAEIPDKNIDLEKERRFASYGKITFLGAIVFEVTLENGFREKGKVTHWSSDSEGRIEHYYEYGSGSDVRRSLYIDNVLYTLSEEMLKASQLVTSDNNLLGPNNELIAVTTIKELFFKD